MDPRVDMGRAVVSFSSSVGSRVLWVDSGSFLQQAGDLSAQEFVDLGLTVQLCPQLLVPLEGSVWPAAGPQCSTAFYPVEAPWRRDEPCVFWAPSCCRQHASQFLISVTKSPPTASSAFPCPPPRCESIALLSPAKGLSLSAF